MLVAPWNRRQAEMIMLELRMLAKRHGVSVETITIEPSVRRVSRRPTARKIDD